MRCGGEQIGASVISPFLVEIIDHFTDGFSVSMPYVKWDFLSIMSFPCYSYTTRRGAPTLVKMGALLDAITEWLSDAVRDPEQPLALDRGVTFAILAPSLIPIHFGLHPLKQGSHHEGECHARAGLRTPG
jgi:hypothetical protein